MPRHRRASSTANNSQAHGGTNICREMNAADLTKALGGQWNGSEGKALCPAHNDHNPSLSITEADGITLVICRVGCDQPHVLDALRARGLRPATRNSLPSPYLAPKAPNPQPTEPCANARATYDYTDVGGNLWARVYRLEPKTFRIAHRTDDGWIPRRPKELAPLYRLASILARPDADVLVVEGEKAADRVAAAWADWTDAPIVVSWMGGANAVKGTDWGPLGGREVTIWADNDQPGTKASMAIAKAAGDAKAASIRVVELPEGLLPKAGLDDAIDDWGEDECRALICNAKPPPAPITPGQLIQLIPLSDITLPAEPQWLIESFLPRNGMTCMFGAPGSAKTFVALDMGMRIAAGLPFHGRSVESGAVIYLAAEASDGAKKRICAFVKEHLAGQQTAPFFLIAAGLDLQDAHADTVPLIEAIKATLGATKPVLIVVDTLARSMGSGDENSAQDMGGFIRNVDRIRDETGAGQMLIVHHCGKDVNQGARGHSSLLGAVDTEIEITHDEASGIRTMRVTKQKEADAGSELNFTLRSVDLGPDAKDVPITSCVVAETEAPQEERKAPKLNDRQASVLQVVTNHFSDHPDKEWITFEEFAVIVKKLTLTKQARSTVRDQLAKRHLIRLRYKELALPILRHRGPS